MSLLNRLKLWRCARVGSGVEALGHIWIHGDGEVHLGRGVVLDGREAPIELRTAKGGLLVIGDFARLEGGCSLEAEGRLEVGPHVRVMAWAKIIDNHFHRVSGNRHERPPPGTVVLEEGVVVEPGAIILPGSHVGRGARIGARSVVSKRIPPGVTVSGNPAKVVPPAPPPPPGGAPGRPP